MTEKIDPREVYGDDGLRIDCECNMQRACTECVDGGLYEDDQLPPPPPFKLARSTATERIQRSTAPASTCTATTSPVTLAKVTLQSAIAGGSP